MSLLGIRSATHVTAEVIAANPQLQAVGAFCIGTNQIDLNAASDAGLAVFNAPFSNTRSVVELALAEIIALARRLVDKNRGLHEGVWDKSAAGSHEVRGRTLGIVGYGNIGSQLSVLAEALGMRVIFYDVVDKLALGNARRCETLEELLAEAEVVTLHVDGRPGNAGIFTAAEFAKMRPRALFLNLCRGIVVDLEALRDALVSGRLAGAAIDVFPNEPHANTKAFTSPLQGLAQRDPHAARRRVDAGGAARHRPLRRDEAGRLRVHRVDGALGEPAAGAERAERYDADPAPAPQRAGRTGQAQRRHRRPRRQHRRPGARHPGHPSAT